jgi:hypothetical protein
MILLGFILNVPVCHMSQFFGQNERLFVCISYDMEKLIPIHLQTKLNTCIHASTTSTVVASAYMHNKHHTTHLHASVSSVTG